MYLLINYLFQNFVTRNPEIKPQNGAPMLNRLNSDKVTRNVISAPRDRLLLKDSTKDCFNTVNNANPPRVMINSDGN